MTKALADTKVMSELEWLKSRQAGIGGSDAGAILGVNKWKTPFQVYLDKTEPITEVNEQSEAAYWGNTLEDMVAKEFAKRAGKKVRRRNQLLQHEQYPFMTANLDREIVGEKAFLECKTVNAFGAKEWEGDDIPASYLVQVMHYMAVTGDSHCYIACLIGGQRFIWKEVQRDEELISMIIQAEKDFWENHVLKKIPPVLDGSSAAEKYLNERYSNPTPYSEINLKSEYKDMINEYLQLKENMKALETRLKEIENNIKNELADNEKGYAGNYEVNWMPVTSSRVDSKLLKSKYPDIYKDVCKESTYRKFRIKECN
ncbi:YqaJ viral recombinase family protein [Clostridium thermopalmarium]|uniref:YqaJ-like viral recombinase domain protein n=1 Tax=Clostridium thermopalmarium DSM 5974 TaxID=1121340 RepID=A0A2T0APE9_9CLOT|nr:YqaJ viral recombinase family protein [Clostridium thermopalmarium]PRR70885.1 YqaJ-like viral recombinase domain protein [Clostridium thermopalmarium DSM 5974]PVZ28809.1 putative phage-type endonuclease [Clostridium thermopalmarium DSM 5974]